MTEISLYNTRSRQKELLRPLDPQNVRMYVCGPTVYDRAHIGNARAVVVFDTLFRLLRHEFGAEHVTYVRNITDVDDKINARAAATKLPGETELQAIRRITDETIGWYHADMGSIGALPPTIEPRATEFIAPMLAMIAELIASGHAYEAEGHVLFSVASDPDYGKLSRRSLEDMRAGARVEVAPYKRDPMDFVLWKPSDAVTPGWDSPWGRGRPGWHIECSAMAYELLGESFDIHGGGIDLAFPHHENELAQSRCAHPHGAFAKIWMHNGMLNVEGDKMSKSLGNFFTVRELLESNIDGQAIRLLLLSTHYRSPLDWSDKRLAEAIAKLTRWKHLKHRCRKAGVPTDIDPEAVSQEAIEAVADDLNTPLALGRILSDLAGKAQLGEEGAARSFFSTLGFFGFDPDRLFDAAREATIDRQLEYIDLIDDYRTRITVARAEKDYAVADALKEKLVRAGHKVSINKDGIDIERTEDFSLANIELLK